MELKNSYFPDHLNDKCAEVPTGALLEIVDELSENARFFMSSEMSLIAVEKMTAVIVVLLQQNFKFKFLPIYLVAEAFYRGSLGEFGGTTRFTIRNVITWLHQIYDKLAQIEIERQSKEDARKRSDHEKNYKSTRGISLPFGTAVSLKLLWVYTGAIKADEWDLYTPDAIVVHLRAGETEKTIKPSMIR